MPMHPTGSSLGKERHARKLASPDLTQLQWLAGMAMQSLIARLGSLPDSPAEREELALWSYRMAQAMMKIESHLVGSTERDAAEGPL